MSRQWITRGLLAAIVLQAGVLTAEFLNSVYPLWTGREIRLKTVPVDPRSLFRGNYARLSYEISRVSLPQDIDPQALRSNELVFVKLIPDKDGFHVYDGVSLSRPDNGSFIRGRLQRPFVREGSQAFGVRYGIEAFFAPKKKALALEEQLRDGGVAVVAAGG